MPYIREKRFVIARIRELYLRRRAEVITPRPRDSEALLNRARPTYGLNILISRGMELVLPGELLGHVLRFWLG